MVFSILGLKGQPAKTVILKQCSAIVSLCMDTNYWV